MPVTALTDGVWGVLATPFTAEGSGVDHDALQRQVLHYRAAGAAGPTGIRRGWAGVVKVNRPTTGLDLNVPFGGVKDSSTNTFREQGSTAVDFYTWTKSVYMGVD